VEVAVVTASGLIPAVERADDGTTIVEALKPRALAEGWFFSLNRNVVY
jgi:hypothetical protein